MGIVTARGSLFANDEMLHNQPLLVDLTTTHSHASARITGFARQLDSVINEAAITKNQKYLDTFLPFSCRNLNVGQNRQG